MRCVDEIGALRRTCVGEQTSKTKIMVGSFGEIRKEKIYDNPDNLQMPEKAKF